MGLKSIHFKKPVTRFFVVVVILKMTTLFERNEDRVTLLFHKKQELPYFCLPCSGAAAVNKKYEHVFILWKEGSKSWCIELICILWVAPFNRQPTYNAHIAFWLKVMMASVAASSATMLTKGKKTTRKKMVRKTDLFSQKSLRFEYLFV